VPEAECVNTVPEIIRLEHDGDDLRGAVARAMIASASATTCGGRSGREHPAEAPAIAPREFRVEARRRAASTGSSPFLTASTSASTHAGPPARAVVALLS